jgi:hypothetical protein
VDISSYEIGLICVDAQGAKTRHTFGRGSFENSETFDTLAECAECLGLEDQHVVAMKLQQRQWKKSADVNEVADLSAEVKTLTQGMAVMLNSIVQMRKVVEAKRATTPSPSALATLAAWGGEDSGIGALSEPVPSLSSAAKPNLRNGNRQSQSSAAQVQDVYHEDDHHHHHHKRQHHRLHHHDRRNFDDDDDDQEEEVMAGDQEDHVQSSESSDTAFADGQGTPALGAVSETLSNLETIDAEDSELEVASAGAAAESWGSGGPQDTMLDDGTTLERPAW